MFDELQLQSMNWSVLKRYKGANIDVFTETDFSNVAIFISVAHIGRTGDVISLNFPLMHVELIYAVH